MKKSLRIISLQLISAAVLSSIPAFNSFIIAMFVISFICGASATFYTTINNVNLRHMILVSAPIYLSYLYYWFPVLNQPSNVEFKVWELVFVVPGAVLGLLSSIVVYLIILKVKREK